MKIAKEMSRKQFAAAVVKQLEKNGISCVLVGGACVSIYPNERHQSRDLDFISPYSHDSITSALAEIGFIKKGDISLTLIQKCTSNFRQVRSPSAIKSLSILKRK
jgi:hypothetical protein